MSQYPPPPSEDQQHYAPIYTAAAIAHIGLAAQQGQQPEPFNFSPPTSQSLYPKIEPSLADPNHGHGGSHEGGSTGNGVTVGPEHHGMPPMPPNAAMPPGVDPNGHPPHQKANRLRKACDSCSIRKVKCDESGPPCRACAALDIPCTFERPSRRRGPPNRHAEAIKKRRLESPNNLSPTSPSSPTNAAHALAALSSHPSLSADSIAPIDTIELLINDYFTYIHPLCPFPHEPTFRESFRLREDYHNRMFLALLASMISVLVAAFPRKPRLHLKAQGRQGLFPNHISLIERCQQVCYAARGSDWLQREDLNVYDAATSYLLGVSYAYTLRWRQSRRYFAEALTIVRGIGLDNAREQYYDTPGAYSREGEFAPDYISQEMAKRIFWTCFVSWRSMAQGGATHDELVILPETPSKPYPQLPVEVDDHYIFPTHIAAQPEGLISMLAGFNANVRVYRSYSALATTELAYGINEVFDWERQSKVLEQGLRNSKQVLADLPPELTVWPDGDQLNQATHGFYPPPPEYMRAKEAGLQQLLPPEGELSDLDKHKTGYEIQKANIYLSQLATRSYITERYFSLRDIYENMKSQNQEQSSPAVGTAGLDTVLHHEPSPNLDQMEQDMQAEKDRIVKDLLHVLGSISQIHMEPNADSFVRLEHLITYCLGNIRSPFYQTHKVRQIVSPLLNMPQDRKSSVAQQAEQYLHHFLDILVRLDRNTGASRIPDAPEDEEAELKHWADLRDYQVKFTEAGGILSLR